MHGHLMEEGEAEAICNQPLRQESQEDCVQRIDKEDGSKLAICKWVEGPDSPLHAHGILGGILIGGIFAAGVVNVLVRTRCCTKDKDPGPCLEVYGCRSKSTPEVNGIA